MATFVKFAAGAGDAPEKPAEGAEKPADGAEDATPVEFTAEQFEALTEALNLEAEAAPDGVVEAVQKLTEEADEEPEQAPADPTEVKASRGDNVTITAAAWEDMQKSIRLGLNARRQEGRLEAEAVVDQFIRAGRAQAADRERLLAAYEEDPSNTVRQLRRRPVAHMVELGHGLTADEPQRASGWVR
ncbi:hypothetical protein ACTXKQ_07740 [Corynebacterium variabile]|uniref:hypothetical protein n=1 Tax=Corynebacterium variabile TaxID=1727 RepID=UPI003FCFD8C2